MAVHDHTRQHTGFHLPTRNSASADAHVNDATTVTAGSALAARSLATVRIITGFVFLWAFLDKTFGWHYATGSGKGWIDGGSPTKGFLSGVSAGPLQSFFHDIAGEGWADTLFMLGLLGLGVALMSGIALRVTAVAGTALMAMMWAAEWPPAQHLSTGAPSMSSNPFVDYHLIYALAMILFAFAAAGTTWGLGRIWAKIPIVNRNRWLL